MKDDSHIRYYICKVRDRAGAHDWRTRGTSLAKGPCVEVGRLAKRGCTEGRLVGWVINAAYGFMQHLLASMRLNNFLRFSHV